MSGRLKIPSDKDLLEDLEAILTVKEEILKLDVAYLKHLLRYVRRRKLKFKVQIDLIMDSQKGSTFSKWANGFSQGVLTYNNLSYAEGIIVAQLRNLNSDGSSEITAEQIFSEKGLDIFNHIDYHFKDLDKIPVTKYTVIYYFLHDKGFIKSSFEQYRKFVRDTLKSNLRGKKFSRAAFTPDDNSKRYADALKPLCELLETISG